jgi:histone H3/H4
MSPPTKTQTKKSPASKVASALGINKSDAKKKRHLSFNVYLRRLANKASGPDTLLSGDLKNTLVRINADLVRRIMSRAVALCRHAGRNTLIPKDLNAALQLVFPRDFAYCCKAETTKALAVYKASYADSKSKK